MMLCEKKTQRQLSLDEVRAVIDRDGVWDGISHEYRISTVDRYFIYKEGKTYRVKVDCYGNVASAEGFPTLELACEALDKLASNLREKIY